MSRALKEVSSDFIEETERRILGLRLFRLDTKRFAHLYARNFLWRCGFTERDFRRWCEAGNARSVWSIVRCVYFFLKSARPLPGSEGWKEYKNWHKTFDRGLAHVRIVRAKWCTCDCSICDFLDPGYMYRQKKNGQMHPNYVQRKTRFPKIPRIRGSKLWPNAK